MGTQRCDAAQILGQECSWKAITLEVVPSDEIFIATWRRKNKSHRVHSPKMPTFWGGEQQYQIWLLARICAVDQYQDWRGLCRVVWVQIWSFWMALNQAPVTATGMLSSVLCDAALEAWGTLIWAIRDLFFITLTAPRKVWTWNYFLESCDYARLFFRARIVMRMALFFPRPSSPLTWGRQTRRFVDVMWSVNLG